eukprot:scaffold29242_cov19-Prasinocladus_malaysianus.AAC.1
MRASIAQPAAWYDTGIRYVRVRATFILTARARYRYETCAGTVYRHRPGIGGKSSDTESAY